MTPEIRQLNENLGKAEVIVNMKDEVNGLKEGQMEIINKIEEDQEFNEAKFAQGAAKFAEIEERMDEMKTQIADGFKKQEDNFNKYISEGKDNEIIKLNKKLGGREHIKNGVLIALIGGILLFIAKGLIEKSITPQPKEKIVYIKATQK